MRRRTLVVLLVLAMLVSLGGLAAAAPPHSVSGDQGRLVVLFESPSVASALGTAHGPAADAYRAELASERAAFADWLAANAPRARISLEYHTVLNGVSIELNGADPAVVAGAPGVRRALHPTVMRPTMDASLPLIGWGEATGQDFTKEDQSAGHGVLVGIIDSGIDVDHPFFDDDSRLFKQGRRCRYSVEDPGDTSLTNCKVIVAKVYTDDEDLTAEDLIGHGTHVAGTVGGVSGTDNQFGNPMSGVAPGAILGNYNVFPGTAGSTTSDFIAAAVDDAVADGMDVLNLSLGGTPLQPDWDVLDLALLAAADVGVISAVAAGNSGPGEQTIQSPGWTPWVITAGASTNPHFAGQTVEAAGLGETGAAVGDFNPFPENPVTNVAYIWWEDVFAGDGEACENRPLQESLGGAIALIKRGTCTFTTKIRNAESVNASGVIIFNNVAGDPVAMGHDGTDPFPEIPAVMVSNAYGLEMVEVDDQNREVTAGGPISDQDGTADIMAGFSSRGPTPDSPEGLLIKPDMVAPGVNVNSSIPCDDDGCGFAFFQGTSMATPHLAGSAATIIWDRGWQDDTLDNLRDEIVKSLLANNALDGVVRDHITGEPPVSVLDEGAGRLLLTAAFEGTYYADPVSISMGDVNGFTASGSTTLTTVPESQASGFKVEQDKTTNSQQGVVEVDASISDDTLTVTVTRPPTFRGDVEGVVIVTSTEGDEIVVPYWVRF